MPYSIFYNQSEDVVEVKISGAAPEDADNARTEAARLCGKNQCHRLLVDLRERVIPESITLRCFSFGVAVAHDLAGIYIAHVLPVNAKSRDDVEFTATVAANRGAVTREFEDAGHARKWLKGLSKPSQSE
jgi:hypothetical protein